MDRERQQAGKGELGNQREGERERKKERDGSASCSRAKVGLCFREGNSVNLQRRGSARSVTVASLNLAAEVLSPP